MILKQKLFLFLSFLLLTGSAAHITLAEEATDPSVKKGNLHELIYVDPNYKNLSQLYWAVARLDINDDEMIDNYLMINNCELYEEYILNDFEWKTIRESARNHILKNITTFPTRIQTMIPITLGDYNTVTEVFDLDEENVIDARTRFSIDMNRDLNVCGRPASKMEGYPLNIQLNTMVPFSIRNISIPPSLAKQYLAIVDKRFESYAPRQKKKLYTREAYMNVNISIMGNLGTAKDRQGENRAILSGEIDSYEIYADPDKELLLYKKQVRKKIRR